MYLTEYQRITIDNFMGLWDRGSLDDVPPDHASKIQNMAFARKREVLTRPGASVSRTIPTFPNGATIVRQFDATFDNQLFIPLACDGVGNIWRLDNYTVLLSLPGLVDFDALNMNNHVYIAPMIVGGGPFNPLTNVVYVWADEDFAVRPAAGLRPTSPITFVQSKGTGNIAAGWHAFAVSYVYNTGYVTAPSPTNALYFPGGTEAELTGIPGHGSNLPNGVIGYLIFATKAQATQADANRAALYEVMTSYDLSDGGATLVIDFFDTDLIIVASADPANGNLYNSMPYLPGGQGVASVALIKYHGRMIIISPNITYDPDTGAWTQVMDGRIFVSHPGAPENFDILTGFLIIQAEFDGNIPRTGFELFGVLYVCKAVGTFATQDNGSDPNDPTNPWVVNMIDGGIGAYHHCVGTISGSQPSLSFNSTSFLANRDGLFIFNGNVLRPELSWKIRGIWQQLTQGLEYLMRVTIDIFNDLFYVMIPIGGPPAINYVLMGDYSLGLDSNNIRWSIYTFPWAIGDIVMAAWDDPRPPVGYFLRIGANGVIYKLDGATTADEVWSQAGVYQRSVAIDNYYQSAPLIPGEIGSLNITRFVRYRMAGQGTLFTTLWDQGETPAYTQQITNVSPQQFPGNYKDIGIQTNFTNEKVIVKFEMNNFNDYVRMARFDIFGKRRWPTRPSA